MKKVLILSSQGSDWEGMFIDGILISEGHELGEGDSKIYLLKASETYGFTSKDVKFKTVTNKDEKDLMDSGSFPPTLAELKGKY